MFFSEFQNPLNTKTNKQTNKQTKNTPSFVEFQTLLTNFFVVIAIENCLVTEWHSHRPPRSAAAKYRGEGYLPYSLTLPG